MNFSPLVSSAFVLAVSFGILAVVPARADWSASDAPRAGGGCKSTATFVSSAVPALQRDGCVDCHGGGDQPATKAFNLGSVGKDNAAACAESLKMVSTANPPQSAIIQAAAGAQKHEGGKVKDAAAFTAALLGWIAHE
ncbi:MAG: hypothetical protein ACLQVI_24665 [Polyangiaceae bacterium]|jgi:hypothetical protein